MSDHFNAPRRVMELNIKSSVKKSHQPMGKTFVFGMMAGLFVALGAAASSTAIFNVSNVGIARTIAGMIFPVGLMMIIFIGGELFTGNCLIFMSVLDKQLTLKQFIRNLFIVFFSNMFGAVIISILVVASGNLDYSGGLLGAYSIKVMIAKMGVSPLTGITSGILCNVFVCGAIFMATASTDIVGKILAIFFPIWAFVVCGFEHCVANMFYIPTGLLAAKNPVYVQRAMEEYGYTAEKIASYSLIDSVQNIVFVTIGNFIGGSLIIGLICYMVYVKEWKNYDEQENIIENK